LQQAQAGWVQDEENTDYGLKIVTEGQRNDLEASRKAVNAYQRDALAKYQSMEDPINLAACEFIQKRNFPALPRPIGSV